MRLTPTSLTDEIVVLDRTRKRGVMRLGRDDSFPMLTQNLNVPFLTRHQVKIIVFKLPAELIPVRIARQLYAAREPVRGYDERLSFLAQRQFRIRER